MLALSAVAVPWFVWVVRYFHGYNESRRPEDQASGVVPSKRSKRPRAHMYEAGAVATFAWAAGTVCLLLAMRISGNSALGTHAAVGWTGATLLVTILILARGHERKLFAAYVSQTTWLRLNRPLIIERYFSEKAIAEHNHGIAEP